MKTMTFAKAARVGLLIIVASIVVVLLVISLYMGKKCDRDSLPQCVAHTVSKRFCSYKRTEPKTHRGSRHMSRQQGCFFVYTGWGSSREDKKFAACGESVSLCGKPRTCECDWQANACGATLKVNLHRGVCAVMSGGEKPHKLGQISCGQTIAVCGKTHRCQCNGCLSLGPVKTSAELCHMTYTAIEGSKRDIALELLSCGERRKVCGRVRQCRCSSARKLQARRGPLRSFRASVEHARKHGVRKTLGPVQPAFLGWRLEGKSGLVVKVLSSWRVGASSGGLSYELDAKRKRLILLHRLHIPKVMARSYLHRVMVYRFGSLPFLPKRVLYREIEER